jgi:tRNA (guanine26-N2/guanine27-N2)-dimethyltransferase
LLVKEGFAEVEVSGVFYNPRMKFCRDVDVIVFSVMPGKLYLDALSASGIRGIRTKLEVGKEVVLNDINPRTVEVIKRNIQRNKVHAEVCREDANILMRNRHFDHVDIDPFGSPANFIDSICFSAKKCISVTATDTAALCGSAVNSCLRKYSCFVEKLEFYPEVGLRVLAGKLACEATKYDKALNFVVCWAKEHYYRIHAIVKRSPRLSAKIYESVGYLVYCKNCLWRKTVPIGETTSNTCDRCGGKVKVYGPMWLGKLKNSKLLNRACRENLKLSKVESSNIYDEARSFLEKLSAEVDSQFYYELHEICRRLRISTPKINVVLEELRNRGFEASRTVLCGTGVKCNAEIGEFEEILIDVLSECNL